MTAFYIALGLVITISSAILILQFVDDAFGGQR